MSTRSSARNLCPPLDNPELTIRRRSCSDPTLLNNFEMADKGNGDLPVPDLRTMEELCQPSLNGRGGPIAIQATNFGLKNDMIQQSIKVNGVTDDALRLYLVKDIKEKNKIEAKTGQNQEQTENVKKSKVKPDKVKAKLKPKRHQVKENTTLGTKIPKS
nr:hypothetical protein [Tanacetum cinerariifolium]